LTQKVPGFQAEFNGLQHIAPNAMVFLMKIKYKRICFLATIAIACLSFVDTQILGNGETNRQTHGTPDESGMMGIDVSKIEFIYADKNSKHYELSKDFSSTQGNYGWTYLRYDGENYRSLAYDSNKSEWSGEDGSVIKRDMIKPTGRAACVIGWTAPTDARVSVVGNIENLYYGTNTEGSEAVIYHNDTKIWPEFDTQKLMSGYSIRHSFVCDVKAGDTIYFRLNALTLDGKNAQTRWLPVITCDHEPAVSIGGSKLVMDPDEYKRVGLTFADSQFGIVPKGATNDYYASWAEEVFKFNGPPDHPTKEKISMQYEYDFPNPTGASGRWWITNIYVDDRSADGLPNGLLAFCHIEFGLDGRTWGVSLMYSDDDGQIWTKIGIIVEQEHDNPMTVNILGVPYLIKDDYFYIFYNDYNGIETSMSVARAQVIDVIAAARDKRVCEWQKYYNGSFCEPGLRGRFSRIIDQTEWTTDDWACHGDTAYCTFLGKYIMTGYNHGFKRGYWISFSDDGLHWSRREWIQEYEHADRSVNVLSPYQSIMAADGTDNGGIDREFYLYSASYRNWTFPDGDLCYLYVTKVSLNKDGVEELQNNTPLRDKTRVTWYSVADFSKTQGKNDWFYMQSNGTALNYMKFNANADVYSGYGSIGAKSQSTPALGLFDFFSARVWSAPREGIVRVRGSVKKESDAGNGSGAIRISHRNRQLLPEKGLMTIGDESGEITFDFTVRVFDYDTILFETANPDDIAGHQVNFLFDITIEYIGEGDADTPLSQQYDRINESISTELLFTGKQGKNGLTYRTWDGKQYGMLDWNASDSRWEIKNTYTIVGFNNQHPDKLDSVRTWTAPQDGTVIIRSGIKCESYKNEGSDGIMASVRKNDEIVWGMMPVGSHHENETVNCTFRLDVRTGDTINFIVNQNETPYNDTTIWTPMIKYIK